MRDICMQQLSRCPALMLCNTINKEKRRFSISSFPSEFCRNVIHSYPKTRRDDRPSTNNSSVYKRPLGYIINGMSHSPVLSVCIKRVHCLHYVISNRYTIKDFDHSLSSIILPSDFNIRKKHLSNIQGSKCDYLNARNVILSVNNQWNKNKLMNTRSLSWIRVLL